MLPIDFLDLREAERRGEEALVWIWLARLTSHRATPYSWNVGPSASLSLPVHEHCIPPDNHLPTTPKNIKQWHVTPLIP